MVLALDRFGIVPGDGPTHQGLFDVGLFTPIPGVEVYAPESYTELDDCLTRAIQSPAIRVIRYPRGSQTEYDRSIWQAAGADLFTADFPGNKEGEPLVILTYGRISYEVLRAAAQIFLTRPVRVIRLGKLHPLDEKHLLSAIGDARRCLVVEEGMRRGGIGERIAAICAESQAGITVKILAAEDFVPHGDTASLTSLLGLDADAIAKAAEF
jgi:1-deoxy-D-xylulose-5-phosphate synthase